MTIKKSFITDITIQTVLPSIINNALLSNGGYILEGDDTNNLLKGGKGNDVLYGSAGNDTLTGGAGADTMAGGVGGDIYYVDNINDVVIENPTTAIKSVAEKSIIHWDDPPPPPVDTINSTVDRVLPSNVENLMLTGTAPLIGTGNELNNVLTGNAGNNALDSLSGNDTLIGGGGNDTLNGGDDSDVMTGGTGNDVYLFSNVFNSTTRETITDMNASGNDTIYLENALYTKLTVTGTLNAANFRSNTTGTAVDSNDYLTYNTSTGILSYDSNGNTAGGAIKIALIGTSTHPALTYTDFFVF
ncbi:MAG: calcium-binding protein [Methylococcaceae bacterium]